MLVWMRPPHAVALLLFLLPACVAVPVGPLPEVADCAVQGGGGGDAAKLPQASPRESPPLPSEAGCAALRPHLVVGAFPSLYQYLRDDDIGLPADEPPEFFPPKGYSWPARLGLSGVLALSIAGWNTVTLGLPTAVMWIAEPSSPWSSNSIPCYPTALGFCKVERWTAVTAEDGPR